MRVIQAIVMMLGIGIEVVDVLAHNAERALNEDGTVTALAGTINVSAGHRDAPA